MTKDHISARISDKKEFKEKAESYGMTASKVLNLLVEKFIKYGFEAFKK
jgi:antitoxin component of RelBE/YafQ-DinJ toxin-antitoxin module